MDTWRLSYDRYEPQREGRRESLCALGNGLFVTRGAAPDATADDVHYPGTYLAGGYDRATTDIEGRTLENEDLVNLPNWLCLTFRCGDGGWHRLDEVEILDYRQELDLRHGILLRTLRFRDEGRTTRWDERRVVAMHDPHTAAMSVELTAEDWSGAITVRSAIDGSVENRGVSRYERLEGRHSEVLEASGAGDDLVILRSRTLQSRLEVAQVARTRLFGGDGGRLEVERNVERRDDRVGDELSTSLDAGAPIRIEKVVAMHTIRDRAISSPRAAALQRAAEAPDFDTIADAHGRAWIHLWESFDIDAHGKEADDGESVVLKARANVFHMLQTIAMPSLDRDAGVPARGWHGEAYRGHIFWDEIFILPLLDLRCPILAREALLYRYRRLQEARRAAREAGYRGAMYPWQSGSSGREESQELHLNPRSGRWIPDPTHRQRHIGAAIAYNLWSYYEITEDHEFLCSYGAEMFIEIARFWASIATYDDRTDRYDIHGVVGPDEYHTAYPDADDGSNGLTNNAYTNVMAAWVLSRARHVLDILPGWRASRLRDEIGLDDAEIERWIDVSRKLRIRFHGDGIISQFEGYERLEEFDWDGYRERYGDIQRLDRILEAEGDSPDRYKASKQADVLMLFYLFSAGELRRLFEQLGYPFDDDLIPRNIEYYMQRTSHGSTLSRVTHSWVLARSDRPAAWRLLLDALDSDLSDIQGGTTEEGIHLGAMAGSVDLLLRGFTGIEPRSGILHFNPCLPEPLDLLTFRLRYRQHVLRVRIGERSLEIESDPLTADPIRISYRGDMRKISPGERCRFRLLTPRERQREDATDIRGEDRTRAEAPSRMS